MSHYRLFSKVAVLIVALFANYWFADESRNFYNDVQTATTSEEFSNLKSQSAAATVYDYSGQSDTSSSGSTSYMVITYRKINDLWRLF